MTSTQPAGKQGNSGNQQRGSHNRGFDSVDPERQRHSSGSGKAGQQGGTARESGAGDARGKVRQGVQPADAEAEALASAKAAGSGRKNPAKGS